MSIRPIDLQTMFMRMTDLSREQAIAQEAAARKQAADDAAVAKDSKEGDERVGKTEEVPDGPLPVDDRDRSKPQGRRKPQPKPEEAEAAEEAKPAEEPVRDPDLGNTIDITG